MPRKGTKLTAEQIERRRAYDRARYKKDPEKYKTKAAARYETVKNDPTYIEKARRRASDWYEAHKDDPAFKKLHDERAEKWRRENRERYLAYRRAYRITRRLDPAVVATERAHAAVLRSHKAVIVDAIVAEAKAAGCGCGERTLVALDLHHPDPSLKEFSVGKTRYQRLWRPEEIRTEAAKCIPLCANCHRKQHAALHPRKAPFHGKDRIVMEAKLSGCVVCGETDRVCLGFHHRDPSTKLFRLAEQGKKGITQEMVREEIAKCVLLCENCHRKVHAGLLTLPSAAGSST